MGLWRDPGTASRAPYAGAVTTAGGWSRTAAQALGYALAQARQVSHSAADDVLATVPDTGDHPTGRAVDRFVEQAGDALRVLEECLSEGQRLLRGAGGEQVDVEAWR